MSVNELLYGTTSMGGAARCGSKRGCGTVFSVDPTSGQETVVHAFQGGSDGIEPLSDLTVLNDALYGTTYRGGLGPSGGAGVVFSVDTALGEETVLHSFDGQSDGANPSAGLIYVNDLFYGTT
ncbi:MAG: choice-of-anchor tandem repeat GloVer-containing protein, partial [Candidatus Tumulicola sp.]